MNAARTKAQLRIEEVIGTDVVLRREGRYLLCRCPFHDERSASFVVFPDSQRFKCFGCRHGGDVVDFYRLRYHISTSEALRRLRPWAESAAPQIFGNDAQKDDRGRETEPFPEAVHIWHRACLEKENAETRAAFDYAQSRGLEQAIGRHLAILTRRNLHERLRFRRRSWSATGHRLLAPLHDQAGRVVSLQGRRIVENDTPKSLNPYGAPARGTLFCNSWSRILLQGNWPAGKPRVVYFGEGLTDHAALSLACWGQAVVSAPGVGNAEDAVGEWACGAWLRVILDRDDAGEKKVQEIADRAIGFGATVTRLVLPKRYTDVCEALIGEGDAERLARLIQRRGGSTDEREAI